MQTSVQPFARKRIDGMLILLLTVVSSCRADLTLVHEVGGGHGKSWVGWGYSLLPSTFPLTWDEAREACEVIPGSMLARVEEWEGEAALAEYLKTVHMKEPLWLANRQTLPEVLQDEQREMHHLAGRLEEGGGVGGFDGNPGESAGPMSLAGSDLTVGGDVGVTLRCAIYIQGVGIVHELCSSRSVSAALCVQRLSSDRPLSGICPPSVHHTWLLVTRQTDTIGDEDTAVTITGLQQCHHRQLGQTYCHLKNGWSKTICPIVAVQSQPLKHHKGKNHHKYHHGVGHGHLRQSHKGSTYSQGASISNNAENPITMEQDYLKLYTSGNHRSKRNAADHKVRSLTDFLRLHRSQAMMRLSPSFSPMPLARAQGLNLDLIESIMQDFSGPKRKKKNKKPKKGRKNDANSQSQIIPESKEDKKPPKNEETPVTKSPPTTPSEDAEEQVKDNSASEPSKAEENVEEAPKDTSTDPIKNFQPADTAPDAIEVTVTVSESKGEDVTQDTQANPEINQNQSIEGEKEESGPSITVAVGPIFVSDALPEIDIIEAAVAEEPMDESMNEEEVVIDINNRQESADETKGESILFPEIPKGVIPDPMPRDSLDDQTESTTSKLIENETPEAGENDSNTVEEPTYEDIDPVRPRADFNEIFFPEDEDQEVIVEASIAAVPTSEAGALQNVIPENSKDETVMEKPGMEDETEMPEQQDTTNKAMKEEGQSMENMEEKEDMADKEMGEDMGDNPDMPEMEETQETENSADKEVMDNMEIKEEMENMQEEQDNENMEEEQNKENVEEKADIENTNEKQESGKSDEQTDTEDDQAIKIIIQQNREEEEEEEKNTRPSNQGKHALLGQILKGIFG